jgi:hypothetical protein
MFLHNKLIILNAILSLVHRLVMGDINIHDVEGMTPLHCAAHLGRARHIAILNEGRLILI